MSDDESPSPYELAKEFFSKVSKDLRTNLKKYGYSELYGDFIAITFLVSLTLGLVISFSYLDTGAFNFGVDVVIFTVIAAAVISVGFAYIFVHVYHSLFGSALAIRGAIRWQILALCVAILVSFVFNSVKLLYGGLAVFFIMLFVYPLVGKKDDLSSKTFDSKLNKIYGAIVLIINLIDIILKLAGLL